MSGMAAVARAHLRLAWLLPLQPRALPGPRLLLLAAGMAGRSAQPRHETERPWRMSKKQTKRLRKRLLANKPARPVRDVRERLPMAKFAKQPTTGAPAWAVERANQLYYEMLTREPTEQIEGEGEGPDADEADATDAAPQLDGRRPLQLAGAGGTGMLALVPRNDAELVAAIDAAKLKKERHRRRLVRNINLYLTEKARTGTPAEIEGTIALAKQRMSFTDATFFCHLAHAYSRTDDPDAVYDVIKRVRAENLRPNVVMWTILMKTYFAAARPLEGFAALKRMTIEDRVLPDTTTYTTALVNAAAYGHSFMVWNMYNEMRENRVPPDTVTYTFMMHMAAREALVGRALLFYEMMKRDRIPPSVVTFNTLMLACSDHRDYIPRCFELAVELEQAGLKPNLDVIETLLKACATRGDLARALQIWDAYLSRDEDGRARVFVPTGKCYFFILATCANATPKNYKRTYDDDWRKKDPAYQLLTERLGKVGEERRTILSPDDEDEIAEAAGSDLEQHKALRKEAIDSKVQMRREVQQTKREFLYEQARKAVQLTEQLLVEIDARARDDNDAIEVNNNLLYIAVCVYCQHNRPQLAMQVVDGLFPAYGLEPCPRTMLQLLLMAGRLRMADLFKDLLRRRMDMEEEHPLQMRDYAAIVYGLTRLGRVRTALKCLLRMRREYDSGTLTINPHDDDDDEATADVGIESDDELQTRANTLLDPALFKSLWLSIARFKLPQQLAVWNRVFDGSPPAVPLPSAGLLEALEKTDSGAALDAFNEDDDRIVPPRLRKALRAIEQVARRRQQPAGRERELLGPV